MIGFVDRGPEGIGADTSYDRDVAEFKGRLDALGEGGHPAFAVVDFANCRMSNGDNGRGLVSLLLAAQKRLKARGGGLSVCNHPAQLNPDLQGTFHLDRVIEIHRDLGEALEAAHSRRDT